MNKNRATIVALYQSPQGVHCVAQCRTAQKLEYIGRIDTPLKINNLSVMSYYDRFNSDGRLKPLEQVKTEREALRSQSQNSSVMSAFLNMFKSLFK